jgi:hypothetical protein
MVILTIHRLALILVLGIFPTARSIPLIAAIQEVLFTNTCILGVTAKQLMYLLLHFLQ